MSPLILNIEHIVKQHVASKTAIEQHPLGAASGRGVSSVRRVEVGCLTRSSLALSSFALSSLALISLSLISLVLMVICNPGAT